MEDLLDKLTVKYSSINYNNLLLRFIYSSVRDYNLQSLSSFLSYKMLHTNYKLVMVDLYKGFTANGNYERYITDVIVIIYNSDYHWQLTADEAQTVNGISDRIRSIVIDNYNLYNFILEQTLYVFL